MKIVKPLTITEGNILNSNVPTNDAPSWDDDEVGGYSIGDEVIFGTNVYESLVDSNEDNPLVGSQLETPSWLDLGLINRLRMFDTQSSSRTIRANNIDVLLQPNSLVNNVGFVNVSGSTITVQMIDVDEGIVYNNTIGIQDNSLVIDWHSYYYGDILYKDEVYFFDLPNYPSASIRVLVEAGPSTAGLGELILGSAKEIGRTIYNTSIGLRDFSKIQEDDFGNFFVQKGRFAKEADFDINVETSRVSAVQKLLSSIRQTPALFIGVDGREELTLYGIYKDFRIIISRPSVSDCNIEVEALSYNRLEEEFSGGSISVPSVLYPFNNATVPSNGVYLSTPFVDNPTDADVHESSDWQISTSVTDFTTPVYESLADEVNLTSIPVNFTGMTINNFYFIRVRYRGTSFGESAWSAPVRFQAKGSTTITTPTFVFPASTSTMSRSVPVRSIDSFTDSAGVDFHKNSDWQFANDSGFTDIVYEQLNSSFDSRTTFNIPDELDNGPIYVRVRYRGFSSVVSSYSAPLLFTIGNPVGEAIFDTPGTYFWRCPEFVEQISLVCVSGGQSGYQDQYKFESDLINLDIPVTMAGKGGSLVYGNDYEVTPGQLYQVVVGDASVGLNTISQLSSQTRTYFHSPSVISSDVIGVTVSPGLFSSNANYFGGNGTLTVEDAFSFSGGGGGAAGYLGGGGRGADKSFATAAVVDGVQVVNGLSGNGGAAGGGAGIRTNRSSGAPGGGVGLYGGTLGPVGAGGTSNNGYSGKGVALGLDGEPTTGSISGRFLTSGPAGRFGGGGGAQISNVNKNAAGGAIRIVYGVARQFPNTNLAEGDGQGGTV